MPNWTKEQSLAINQEGSNILVSAGAGSGKTAVLSERVLRKVKDGTNIDRILILTFTKAAADEFFSRFQAMLSARSVWADTTKKLTEEDYDTISILDLIRYNNM